MAIRESEGLHARDEEESLEDRVARLEVMASFRAATIARLHYENVKMRKALKPVMACKLTDFKGMFMAIDNAQRVMKGVLE